MYMIIKDVVELNMVNHTNNSLLDKTQLCKLIAL